MSLKLSYGSPYCSMVHQSGIVPGSCLPFELGHAALEGAPDTLWDSKDRGSTRTRGLRRVYVSGSIYDASMVVSPSEP
jgi:hypothetical protein